MVRIGGSVGERLPINLVVDRASKDFAFDLVLGFIAACHSLRTTFKRRAEVVDCGWTFFSGDHVEQGEGELARENSVVVWSVYVGLFLLGDLFFGEAGLDKRFTVLG